MKEINLAAYAHIPCVLALPDIDSEEGRCYGCIRLPAIANSSAVVLDPKFVDYDTMLLGGYLVKSWGVPTRERNYVYKRTWNTFENAKLAKDAVTGMLRHTGYKGPIKRVK